MSWRNQKKNEHVVLVKRHRESEMEKPIQDLINRGYDLVYGPVEQQLDGKRFDVADYKRQNFVENTFHSFWIAKMKKVN